MPTITRKKLLNTVTAVDIGCSSCRRPKLFHIFRPKAKLITTKFGGRKQNHHHYSSSSSYNKDSTTTTFSPNTDDYASFSDHGTVAKSATPVKGFGRVGGESVAVEKDSGDPYLDFRHSMLQMILENEIYSKDDLRELLNCFLQLNAPCNHGIIIRAFTDIWNGVFSVRSSASTMQLRLARKSRDY
ncbi:putative transcription factor OFP family [Rosa chinensis]|uniref:Transcription repressor n=1 Tax=Rosa chinensis TaxID=74649 RepID=A0A2P6RCD8_ROSCH|nr:transcription repressor OFP6 [Rosa chinensis]PRQ44081.1 putative transcription factor OFP family [Rosa chinensis]